MTLLRKANEQTQSEWIPVPEGLWRFRIGVPELKFSERFNSYQVRFPLQLAVEEQKRAIETVGTLPANSQLSYRVFYTVGLSLGYVQRDGQYKSTKLIDLLATALGTGASRGFRQWIADGGGPPRPDDLNDQQAELEAIGDWLGWWEDLEVYGSVTHREAESGTVFANFSGPLAVGSLPGQKDNEYTTMGRGKLKAIKMESGEKRESHTMAARPAVQYTAAGTMVEADDDLPF